MPENNSIISCNEMNGQSAAKHLSNGEGSTTIPTGSTDRKIGKQPVYLRKKNVIYKITNTVNNKIYIGSASYYDKRIGTHVSWLRKGKHDNPYLQSAWDKYGEEFFIFEVIDQVNTPEELTNREQYWMDYHNSYDRTIGYNLCKVAGSRLGQTMSEEAKRKIGEFWKGKSYSEEQKLKRRKQVTENQGKPVNVYDKYFNFLYECDSISEASRKTGVSISGISKQCSKLIGTKRNYTSFIFRYKDIV